MSIFYDQGEITPTLVPISMTKMNGLRKSSVRSHNFKVVMSGPPYVFLLHGLQQQEEEGGLQCPPCYFFGCSRRKRGAGDCDAPLVFFFAVLAAAGGRGGWGL